MNGMDRTLSIGCVMRLVAVYNVWMSLCNCRIGTTSVHDVAKVGISMMCLEFRFDRDMYIGCDIATAAAV